jgi:vitamin B12 transporter
MTLAAYALILAMAAPGQGVGAAMLHGHVQDRDGHPLAGVTLALKTTASLAVTNDQGDFVLPVPPDARPPFTVSAKLPGYVTATVTVLGAGGLGSPLVLGVVRPTFRAAVIAPAGTADLNGSGAQPPPVDARLVVRPLDVVRTPGTQADLMRDLGTLPGVVAIDDGAGLFVRGGDVSETQVLLDGVVVNHPYRYETPTGGFRGSVDAFMTKDTTFTTGGFGSAYGNVLSAVADLSGQDRPRAPQLTATAGLAGVAVSAAQPLGSAFGVRVSANRSTPAALFAVNPSSVTFDELPGGWDASGALYGSSHTLGDFKVFLLSQADHVGLELQHDAFVGLLHSGTSHSLVAANWQRALGTGWQATVSFGVDDFISSDAVGVQRLSDGDVNRSGRLEFRGRALGWALRIGETADMDLPDQVGTVPVVGGDFGGVSGAKAFSVRTRSWTAGTYLDAERTLGRLTVEAGARTDYFSNSRTTTVDPRLGLLIGVTANHRVRAAWGHYHQAPSNAYFDEVGGHVPLVPMEATHHVVGYEVGSLTGPTFLRVEAYDKTYTDLPLEDPVLRFAATGHGSAKGVDAFVRHVWPRLTLRANASWLAAARRWTPWDQNHTFPVPAVGTWPPDFDIPYAFEIVTAIKITPRWSIDTGWRTAAGRPFTPAIDGALTPTGYKPIWGAINSERVPRYERFDISASRSVSVGHHTAQIFLSAGNVLDRHNYYEYSYSADYRTRSPKPSGSPRSIYAGITFIR